MSLISILIFVLVLGAICWIITLIPIPEPFKTILWIIVGLIGVVYLLESLGSFRGLSIH